MSLVFSIQVSLFFFHILRDTSGCILSIIFKKSPSNLIINLKNSHKHWLNFCNLLKHYPGIIGSWKNYREHIKHVVLMLDFIFGTLASFYVLFFFFRSYCSFYSQAEITIHLSCSHRAYSRRWINSTYYVWVDGFSWASPRAVLQAMEAKETFLLTESLYVHGSWSALHLSWRWLK